MRRRKAKLNSDSKYDTLSITMELERPLLYNEEEIEETNRQIKRDNNLKKLKKAIATLLIVISLFIAGFLIWLSNGYDLYSEAKSYLQSDSTVQVTTQGSDIYFTPINKSATKGFIFYPGERINASAYAKLCKQIASKGYKVIAVDMPFNYATFGKNKAYKIIEDNPNIQNWIIGGDSLGGTSACKYAAKNKNVDGIVLISSYPTDNISDLGFKVLSISGSKDNVIDYEALVNSKDKLPKDTTYIEIEGANHSQFGSYGSYSGDGDALISEDEQINIAVNNIVKFLNDIK